MIRFLRGRKKGRVQGTNNRDLFGRKMDNFKKFGVEIE